MASVLVMGAGAVLNTLVIAGTTTLAGYLDEKNMNQEQIRLEKALEKYQRDVDKWQVEKKNYQQWLDRQYMDKRNVEENLEPTDEAFVLYAKTQAKSARVLQNEPEFENYYRPLRCGATYSLIMTVGGVILFQYLTSKC